MSNQLDNLHQDKIDMMDPIWDTVRNEAQDIVVQGSGFGRLYLYKLYQPTFA